MGGGMTSEHDQNEVEKRIDGLIAPLGKHDPEVDSDKLAEIERRTWEEFTAAGTASEAHGGTFGASEPEGASQTAAGMESTTVEQSSDGHASGQLSQRPRRMRRWAAAAIALAAVAFVFKIGFDSWGQPDVALGEVLELAHAHDALKLQVVRDGQSTEVWIQQPGYVRWQLAADRYQILRGSHLWEVDGSGNSTRTRQSGAAGPVSDRIDLLALLEVQPDDRDSLLSVMPSDRRVVDDQQCLVYQRAVVSGGRRIVLEVVANADSLELVQMTARDATRRPTGPPLAELRLLASDPEFDESHFRVPVSLSADGRVGKISDAQGIVTLRTDVGRRWTPVFRELAVRPGDWLRTDTRGANAATVQLVSQHTLTVGPASLIEFLSPIEIRVHSGEVQVERDADAAGVFQLTGPAESDLQMDAAGKQFFRIGRSGALQKIDATPIWLAGYEGTSAEDSIGSLIVNVDGRSQSLSVGEHLVQVEIRDQIARTTIEETFINHTDSRTEGVFHFPLPQDASISGFGMWIGGELVEADVVEKQRAREIYETILRENRDPGLLEWTGGNIFKARVFPIEAHSEKRVKIVYTQVLPLQGQRYRYSYALKSEMLAVNPLRQLSIDVTVSSAIPLANLDSPTHTVRTQLAKHSGRVQFTAQEYTPTRDFEVVCDLDRQQSDVVVIPHQRGDDGYFLMQLMPPTAGGRWRQEVIPDGDPLQLILLCDTSASMDSAMRETQQEFVGAVLAALGPQDRFNLAACDVATHWAFPGLQEPAAEHIDTAREYLEGRVSLGWSDLARAFESVAERVSENTHVIYIGDGIVSTTDHDPQAFVDRLQRIYDGHRTGTFHSVSVGSTYESTVLKAIAALGGGSTRQIVGDRTPQQTAFDLLNEIAQPGLKNVQLEFRGVRVAAVYPEVLPNIAAGTQQIIVGRYLPEGVDQSGDVIVSGERDGEPVRFVAQFQLADAEAGNSFIPRLWARAHLDELLQDQRNAQVREDIIALSEEFHIITPFTSLLVLETDADRERFGVKRRFQMRDGERFFADGRDNAAYELKQQSMRKAGTWRLGLRKQVLLELTKLGRNAGRTQNVVRGGGVYGKDRLIDRYSVSLGRRGLGLNPFADETEEELGRVAQQQREFATIRDESDLVLDFGPSDLDLVGRDMPSRNETGPDYGDDGYAPLPGEMEPGLAPFSDSSSYGISEGQFAAGEELAAGSGSQSFANAGKLVAGAQLELLKKRGRLLTRSYSVDGLVLGFVQPRFAWNPTPAQHDWFEQLFPPVPAAPAAKAENPPLGPQWTPEARQLADSLLRRDSLLNLKGGVIIERSSQNWDVQWDQLVASSQRTELFSPEKWLTVDTGAKIRTVMNWCDSNSRGALAVAERVARSRQAQDSDRQHPPLYFQDSSWIPLYEVYRDHQVQVERPSEQRAVLTLSSGLENEYAVRWTIDEQRQVVLKQESLHRDKLTQSIEFSGFVEIADSWWATRIQTTDANGATVQVVRQQIQQLDQAEFAAQFTKRLALRSESLEIKMPLPETRAARLADDNGSITLSGRIRLMRDSSAIQNRETLFQQFEEFQRMAEPSPGLLWLQMALEQVSGRREGLRKNLHQQAQRLLAADHAGLSEYGCIWFAHRILQWAYPIMDWNEYGRLVQTLKPVFEIDQSDADVVFHDWQMQWINVLDNQGKTDEALQLAHQMAVQAAGNAANQTRYAGRLSRVGRVEESLQWLRKQMALGDHWTGSELESLRASYADQLEQAGRWSDVLPFLVEWLQESPTSSSVYSRYLTALIMTDQVDKSEAQAIAWMDEAIESADSEQVAIVRLDAAVKFALGNGHRLHRYHGMELKWMPHLQKVARRFARSNDHFRLCQQIMNSGHFAQSDEADQLRSTLLKWLLEETDQLSVQQVASFAAWLQSGRLLLGEGDEMQIRMVTEAEWIAISDRLVRIWEQEADIHHKHQWQAPITQIYSARLPDSYIPFLRRLVAEAPGIYRQSYQSRLFHSLLSATWSEEVEAEALELLLNMSDAETPAARRQVEVPLLLQFVDGMVNRRIRMAQTALQDEGNVDDLTRSERAELVKQFVVAARTGVADRLAAAFGQLAEDDELRGWVRMEQAYLDTQLRRHRDETLAFCWTLLDRHTPWNAADIEGQAADADERSEFQVADLLVRAFTTVQYFAAGRDAEAELIDQVERYIDQRIAADVERQKAERQASGEPVTWLSPWKIQKYSFLIALDRPQQLEQALRRWISEDDWNHSWRLILGRLRAEQGDLDEAIQLFEFVQREDQLEPADALTLSDWYLVVDQRDQHELARFKRFERMSENQLNQFLQGRRGRFSSREMTQVDAETRLAFQVLFRKTASPGNYYWLVREMYVATGDFELLRMVPDSVLGRTRQQIYPALQSLDGTVLAEIRKEATADELLERLNELRVAVQQQSVKETDGVEVIEPGNDASPVDRRQTDLRALDLLEMMVERRCSEVLNQPGPHIERAAAALQRAAGAVWQPGERRQMSGLMRSLGQISAPKLAAAQRALVERLRNELAVGTVDRLWVSHDLAHLQFYSYSQKPVGLELMQVALNEFRSENSGPWPPAENQFLDAFASMYEAVGRYHEAEQLIDGFRKLADDAGQRDYLVDRLNWVHERALRNGGATSLGSDRELFQNLVIRLLAQTETPNDNTRYGLLNRTINLYDLAVQSNYAGAVDGLIQFADVTLPQHLKRQTNNYSSLINQMSSVLSNRISSLKSLEFLLDRVDEYPVRYEPTWQNSWQQHGSQLAHARWYAEQAVKKDAAQQARLAAAEKRLLELTLAELRRDLWNRRSRNNTIYYMHNTYFWNAKRNEFIRVAESLLAERLDSPRSLLYIANYLYGGVGEYDRAIEVLADAHRRGLLDDAGQLQLIHYFHERNRFGESIAMLEPFVERSPDRMDLRVLLLRAYYRVSRNEQRDRLLEETHQHFHLEGRWVESAALELAKICSEIDRPQASAGYYEEAISLHQRSHPNRGIGDGTLSQYYTDVAAVYSTLNMTEKAVDAAAAAIVSWGNNINQRSAALNQLVSVLGSAADLDEYIESWQQRVDQSGQDSPIIRRALGAVFQQKEQFERAVQHYRIAVTLQPHDRQLHQSLIECYQKLGDRQAIVDQLLAQVEFDRHNFVLYQRLTEQVGDNDDFAERAATSIVEAAPAEAESHQMLARLRQEQTRWDDAIRHWKRVSELRKLEPGGLLGLTAAQIEAGRYDEARQSIRTLRRRSWPPRFHEIGDQIHQLAKRVQQRDP